MRSRPEPGGYDARASGLSSLALQRLLLIGLAVAAGIAGLVCLASGSSSSSPAVEGPLIIDGEQGKLIEGVHITSSEGPCLIIRDASDVTIRASEIGPCGGNGIVIERSARVQIIDSYVHPEFPVNECCDKGNGIFAVLSSDILIEGNVVAYGESNVELLGVTNASVNGNFLLNPLGPFPRGSQLQVWSHGRTRSSDIRVEGNYALASRDPGYKFPEGQTDAINFGFVDGVIAEGNYISGGRYHSGCGLMADRSANGVQFLDNTVVDTGQCGIGISSGTNQVVDGNRVYTQGIDGEAGNVGLYVWNLYSVPCGPVQVSNNVVVLVRKGGSFSSYWQGGDKCAPVTMSNNTFDQEAIDALTPIDVNHPPPALPLQKYEQWTSTPSAASE